MSKRTLWIVALLVVAYVVMGRKRSSAPTPVGVDVGPVTGISYA